MVNYQTVEEDKPKPSKSKKRSYTNWKSKYQTLKKKYKNLKNNQISPLKRADLLFAIDTWIRAYKNAAEKHPNGETARKIKRMKQYKKELSKQ